MEGSVHAISKHLSNNDYYAFIRVCKGLHQISSDRKIVCNRINNANQKNNYFILRLLRARSFIAVKYILSFGAILLPEEIACAEYVGAGKLVNSLQCASQIKLIYFNKICHYGLRLSNLQLHHDIMLVCVDSITYIGYRSANSNANNVIFDRLSINSNLSLINIIIELDPLQLYALPTVCDNHRQNIVEHCNKMRHIELMNIVIKYFQDVFGFISTYNLADFTDLCVEAKHHFERRRTIMRY
jgi:hypothetical protein